MSRTRGRKLDGHENRLAGAMREVFSEAVEGAIKSRREEIFTTRITKRDDVFVKGSIKAAKKNMSARLPRQRKKSGELAKSA